MTNKIQFSNFDKFCNEINENQLFRMQLFCICKNTCVGTGTHIFVSYKRTGTQQQQSRDTQIK